jgi:hypothetical protein
VIGADMIIERDRRSPMGRRHAMNTELPVKDLPQAVQRSAYVKGGEAAWSAGDAMVVLDWLDRRNLAVAEIEIWLPTEPGPTIPSPYIYRWEAGERQPCEAWVPFRSRANDAARRYIQRFAWHGADAAHRGTVPFFNLITDAEEP